jgi:hypothetical protein
LLPGAQSGEGAKSGPSNQSGDGTRPRVLGTRDALSRQIAAARAKVEAHAAASGPTTSQSGESADVSGGDTGASSREGGGGGVELAFRLLDGRRVSRGFPPGATVGDLLEFLRTQGVDTGKTVLTAGGGGKLVRAAVCEYIDRMLLGGAERVCSS